MLSKWEINGQEFADDVRSQMADHEMLEKYGLSHEGLEEVFKTLLEIEMLSPSEFEAWTIFCNRTVPLDVRLSRRWRPHNKFDVFERDHPLNRGIILNASEHGLGIKGIRAEPEAVVMLEIPAGPLPGIGPLTLQSRCQWIREAEGDDDFVGGFYVMAVVQGKWEEFRQVIGP